jgi:NAD(P)-dependent dehydrogenase (short-subunit alcohol dehydrogenase family)
MPTDTNKVWFITGTSTGARLALVKTLLREGYRVAVTTNNLQSLAKAVGEHPADRLLPLQLKPRDAKSPAQALIYTLDYFAA